MFRVTDVTTPKFDANSPDAKRIEDTVKRQESDEIFGRIRGVAGKRTRHQHQSGGAGAGPRQQRAGHQLDMQIEPSAAAFAARYAAGEPQVVWTTLVADLETPVSAFLKIAGARPKSSLPKTSVPMSFLLESVEGGAVRGRYSIIGLEPDVIFRINGAARRDQPHAAE